MMFLRSIHHIRRWVLLCSLSLVLFSSMVLGSQEAFQEDIERSFTTPVISGFKEIADDIIEGKKAALTLCSTTVRGNCFSYDHTALVFEVKHPRDRLINLMMVHFGENKDGEGGRPTINGRETTLYKVLGGEKIYLDGRQEKFAPLYRKHVSFVVSHNDAIHSLTKLEHDHHLSYALMGGKSLWTWYPDRTYNCSTYVDRCLGDSGIITGFNQSWSMKRASNLINACRNLNVAEKMLHDEEEKEEYNKYKKKSFSYKTFD